MNEYSSKMEKAVKLANQKGFDGLIIYSDGPTVMASPSYFNYFSGLRPMGVNGAIIVSKSGDSVVLVDPKWYSRRASELSSLSKVQGSDNFAQDLVKIMQDFKITGSVGVMGTKQMTADLFSVIAKQAKITPAEDIVEQVAKEKSQREMDNIKVVAKIAEAGFTAFLEHARIGVREYELAAEMGYAMQSAGSEDNFNLLSSGKSSFEMHAPTNRRLEDGDIVIVEITPVLGGQFLQLCRTIALGKPPKALADNYAMLALALKKALEAIKPGEPAGVMSKAMNKIISDAGYGKYCYPPYMRTRGHGLGTGSHAPGFDIDENTAAPFAKGQVVVVHPNQWLPETGYLACGETILVTDTGMERLSNTETKLYVKE